DLIVRDAIAAAQHEAAAPKSFRIPGDADRGAEIVQIRFGVREEAERRGDILVTQSKVERQILIDSPIVLREGPGLICTRGNETVARELRDPGVSINKEVKQTGVRHRAAQLGREEAVKLIAQRIDTELIVVPALDYREVVSQLICVINPE